MYIRGGEVYEDEEIYDLDQYDEDDNDDNDDYLEKDDYSLSYDDIISIVFLDRMNVRKITLSY
jgi:hypothetical protein